jgi:DNA topoisomerase VI subunit B
VVVNLLNNAAKYTDTGGLVRMTVSQEGTEAVVRVRDNGVGIAPDLLPHVFELFTQIDGSLGRSYGGLGIGLALALSPSYATRTGKPQNRSNIAMLSAASLLSSTTNTLNALVGVSGECSDMSVRLLAVLGGCHRLP